MAKFLALGGFYQLLFLYLEPMSTMIPALMSWVFPGSAWFHHQLIPSALPAPTKILEPRTEMMVWQLGNCYLLLGLISSLVFRAARDSLPNDPVAQERIVGALLAALAIADQHVSLPRYTNINASVTSIAATLVGLPPAIRYQVMEWNSMVHGNITTVVVLFAVRMAWFFGVARTRYYFGQAVKQKTA
ncbi:hypothetical protein C8J57DRAFT_1553534 [Mycena rebaudengoi]|nr:hypothetical protein C8J57DRAFT_1553534 [Mycena rebaudengoi]